MSFNNPDEKITSDSDGFYDFISLNKDIWFEKLVNDFPSYSANKLKYYIEDYEINFVKDEDLIVLSTIIENLVEEGSEEYF